MAQKVFVPFDRDIIEQSLHFVKDESILIYPTKVSCDIARRSFYPQWHLQKVDFITMEELKHRGFVSDLPTLEDEKRILSLFLVLSAEDKNLFHLSTYEDGAEWGRHFFDFYEELAEEEVAPDSIIEGDLYEGYYLQGWQEEYLTQMAAIRNRYEQFITIRGFTDKIFIHQEKLFEIPPSVKHCIFVNQYYYSKLEESIITKLESNGIEVIRLYQGPSGFHELLSIDPIQRALQECLSSKSYRIRQIKVFKHQGELEMVVNTLDRISDKETDGKARALLDPQLHRKAYRALFDNDYFGIGYQRRFIDSDLYQIFVHIRDNLGELICEEDKIYLPLRCFRDLLSFPKYLTAYGFDADFQALHRQLNKLIDRDILYVDSELKLFGMLRATDNYDKIKDFCRNWFALVLRFASVTDMEGFIKLLEEPDGIESARFISPDEDEYSDLRSKYWSYTANFCAIAELGICEDWSDLFGSEKFQVATGILGLWLDFLKSAMLSYRSQTSSTPKYHLCNLMDSRNRCFDEVIFLNLLEGVIPATPKPVWLLNEYQRRKLRLKTWEDIRNWEKYYFYRLLFNSESIELHYYDNPSEGIEASSLIEELKLAIENYADDALRIDFAESNVALDPREIYKLRYASQEDIPSLLLPNPRKKVDSSFFSIPLDLEKDFGEEKTIFCTYYSMANLLRNAFAWYVGDLRKIREYSLERSESLSRKVFGTILHRFVNRMFELYKAKHQDLLVKDYELIKPDSLHTELQHLLNDEIYNYMIPKNYNREFLFSIMADSLCDAIYWVFDFVLYANIDLVGQTQKIIPETDDPNAKAGAHKTLLSKDDTECGLVVKIRGNADLRMETPTRRYIIDFKTGKSSADQLAIYEWYYYLLEVDADAGFELVSMICQLFERSAVPSSDMDKTRNNLKKKLIDQLGLIASSGYLIGARADGRLILPDITRKDIFKTSMWGEK